MKVDVRTHRLDRGWSAEKLAEEIGVTPHVIYQLEATSRRPQPENAFKVAKYFGMKPSEMWPTVEATEPAGEAA